MKATRIYGLIATAAAMAVCASAFAQGGPPPRDDQGGPPPGGMGRGQDQGGPGMGGPGMRRMGPPMEPLFMRPDVRKELKLTDEQIKKLEELFPRQRGMGGPDGGPDGLGPGGGRGENGGPQRRGPGGGGPGGGQRGPGGHGDNGGPGFGGPGGPGEQGGAPRERGEGMGPGMMGPDAMDGKLADIFNDHQMHRLKELRLQREGAMALMRRDIADKIGLSEDERYKIRGMMDEAMENMSRPEEGQRIDRKAMEAQHHAMSEKILKSLTSKQRDKWDDLCGKPFKFDEKWHPEQGMRRGGPGGPGGEGQREPGRRGGDDDDRGGPPPPSDNDDGGGVEQGMLDEAGHGGE